MESKCYLEGFTAMLGSHGIRYFTAWELCAVGERGLRAPAAHYWQNIIPTVKLAQEARIFFGRPATINTRAGAGLFGRGYRDPDYNRRIGGATNSQHVFFRALDFHITGIAPRRLFDFFDTHPESAKLGLGLYNTFVHIDTRGTRARFGNALAQ